MISEEIEEENNKDIEKTIEIKAVYSVIKNLKLGYKAKNIKLTQIDKLSEKAAYRCLTALLSDKANQKIVFREVIYDERNSSLFIHSNKPISLNEWEKEKSEVSSYEKVDKYLFHDLTTLLKTPPNDIDGQLSFADLNKYNNLVLEEFTKGYRSIMNAASEKIANEFDIDDKIGIVYDFQQKSFEISTANSKALDKKYIKIKGSWYPYYKEEKLKAVFQYQASKKEKIKKQAADLKLRILLSPYFDEIYDYFEDNEELITTRRSYVKSSNTNLMLNINLSGTELIIPDFKEREEYLSKGETDYDITNRPLTAFYKNNKFFVHINDQNKDEEPEKQRMINTFFDDGEYEKHLLNSIRFNIEDMPDWIKAVDRFRRPKPKILEKRKEK